MPLEHREDLDGFRHPAVNDPVIAHDKLSEAACLLLHPRLLTVYDQF